MPDADPAFSFFDRGNFCKAVASYFLPKTAPYLLDAACYDQPQLPESAYLPFHTLRKKDALLRIAFSLFASDCYSHARKHWLDHRYAT